MSSEVAVRESAVPAQMTRDQLELLKSTYAKGSTDDEFRLFVQVCDRTQLNPFARQIYCIKRGNQMVHQVSIDGARLIAERSGKYAGQRGPYWTTDGKEWTDVWLDKMPPKAAKVAVLRSDFKEPLWAVATWDAYCPGTNPIWQKMGPHMLAKCAEMLALRKAFPQELSGLYSAEEMAQADSRVERIEGDTVDVTTGEVLQRPKGGDIISKPQLNSLKSLVVRAFGAIDPKHPTPEQREASRKWFDGRLAALGVDENHITVEMMEQLSREILEFARSGERQEQAPSDDGNIEFVSSIDKEAN